MRNLILLLVILIGSVMNAQNEVPTPFPFKASTQAYKELGGWKDNVLKNYNRALDVHIDIETTMLLDTNGTHTVPSIFIDTTRTKLAI